MKKKLIIFDMDGLMFETGRLAYKSYLMTAIKNDFEMNTDVYYYLTGRTDSGIIAEITKIYNTKEAVAWRKDMLKYKFEILDNNKRVYKKPGLNKLIEYLKNNDYIFVLASSTIFPVIKTYLKYEGIEDYFDFIVSGDQVKYGKPNPEIFIKACEMVNIEPKDALVLEDSIAGIKAANAAGIDSVLIEDDITDMISKTSGKHIVLDLKELNKHQKENPNYHLEDLEEVIILLEEEFNN
jgi:HAD superfamily hydrolase (TIGR01509 family)